MAFTTMGLRCDGLNLALMIASNGLQGVFFLFLSHPPLFRFSVGVLGARDEILAPKAEGSLSLCRSNREFVYSTRK